MHTASSYLPVHVVRPALKLFDGSLSSPSIVIITITTTITTTTNITINPPFPRMLAALPVISDRLLAD